MIALLSIIVGAALGLRFKVKILFPVQALAIVTVCSVLRSEPGYTIIYMNILLSACLQVGFIGGAIGRNAKAGPYFDPELNLERVD